MSLLFEMNFSETYNLAKLSIILHKHNGEYINTTRISTDGFFIGNFSLGSDDPIPMGYYSFVQNLAQKYGFQYTVDKKKDGVIGSYSCKKQVFTITEKVSAVRNYEELYKTAKLRAEDEIRNEFLTYQTDSDYRKFRELPIITGLSKDIMAFLSNYSLMKYMYLQSTSMESGYTGAYLWILVREDYVDIASRRIIDYDYTYDFKFSAYGYGALQQKQYSGVRKSLKEKIYTSLRNKYPDAIIMSYGDVASDNGFCMMSIDTSLKSW